MPVSRMEKPAFDKSTGFFAKSKKHPAERLGAVVSIFSDEAYSMLTG